MKSNMEWKKWGETDPLFGVSSWAGKALHQVNPWTDSEFYAMGEIDWKDFRKHWEEFGVRRGVCLEIGCGAGRLTKQLVNYFPKVEAVDVSEGMVYYARKRIKAQNVDFIITDGLELPLVSNSVDAVLSTDVFQHLDNLSDAAQYLQNIYRVMAVNSSIMLHLPIEIEWIFKQFDDIGFQATEFRIFRLTKDHTAYPFVCAKKATNETYSLQSELFK